MITLREAALLSVAEKIGDACSVWEGVGARDIEHVLREAASHGLVALAEPVQEPVAKVELMATGGNAGLATRIVEIDNHLRERLRPGQLLYTAPPQRPAEPVQEPAFHGFMSADGTQVDVCFTPSAPRADGAYATAYYTTPPQRKPLTADWLWVWLMDWCKKRRVSPADYDDLFRLVTDARNVEAAHGIKE